MSATKRQQGTSKRQKEQKAKKAYKKVRKAKGVLSKYAMKEEQWKEDAKAEARLNA